MSDIGATDTRVVPSRTVAHYLDELHYLGGTGRGFACARRYEPDSLVIEKYRYENKRGHASGVQWLVHRVDADGSLMNVRNFDTRREAAEFVVGGLRHA